ncbi:MAG: helix-turn-helix transcriptional regulator [Acidimicrobiia bacterium]|nr:helix-turn-helix transcriptional regulator [Acidimicrobiia bacterium]
MTKRNSAVYIISVAAELAGVHPQTLRIYERKGLIEPFRTPGGTRRYSDEDLERLGLIQELTAAGVNLEGVRRILTLQADNNRLRSQVDRLRRLLGEAQSRTGADIPEGTPVFKINVTRRRNLPDIVRKGPFGQT